MTRLTLSEADHDRELVRSGSPGTQRPGQFIGSGRPLTERELFAGYGLARRAGDGHRHWAKPAPLAALVVHVIEAHRLALNPAAIDIDRLERLHAELHGPELDR